MVEPGKRTNKIKKVNYKSPSGQTRTRYLRKKSKKKSCQACKKSLQGKRPGRPHSNNLCHVCLQEYIRSKIEGIIPLKFKK